MPRALILIRKEPHYRFDSFAAGVEAAGYRVGTAIRAPIEPDDIVVSWNRYGANEQICDQFEAAGARAVIAENGYLNPGGGNPKFDAHEGKPGYYALALSQHGGAGRWPVGGPERWDDLGITLKPWRKDGDHVLICPNRPFGSRKMMPPPNWAEDVRAAYAGVTKREIRVRAHPGNTRPARTLEQDLERCYAMVIWASSSGLHALINGIPVICESPHWICKGAAMRPGLEREYEMDGAKRLAAMQRLAWAQWTVDEIASGLPFDYLLRRADQEKVAVSA